MFYFPGGSVVILVLLRYISWLRYKEFGHWVEVQHQTWWQNARSSRHQGHRVDRKSRIHFCGGSAGDNVLNVKNEQLVGVKLPHVLLQVPLVFRFQWAVRALVNNILMFCLNVLLYIPDLGVFIVTEIALVLQSFVLTIDVPLQGTFIDGDKVAVLACESDAPVNRLNVPEECALGPGHKGALLTWKPSICVRVHLCNSSTPGNLWTVAHGCWCCRDHYDFILFLLLLKHILINV